MVLDMYFLYISPKGAFPLSRRLFLSEVEWFRFENSEFLVGLRDKVFRCKISPIQRESVKDVLKRFSDVKKNLNEAHLIFQFNANNSEFQTMAFETHADFKAWKRKVFETKFVV